VTLSISSSPLAIGIEIGGTKLQVGVGTTDANLFSVVRQTVNPSEGGGGIRRALGLMVRQVVGESDCTLQDIARIGIGFGGPLDTQRGVTLKSFQIEGWDEFPLKSWAAEQWGRPVRVQNDAGAAGLAEALRGAGRGCSRVFYLTVGSGIGGGWIVDGAIDDGQGLGAAEVGHLWLPSPGGGEPVELEQFCSGWAIGRRARAVAAAEATAMLGMAGAIDRIDAKIVYAAAENGDRVALHLLDETCQVLGMAISTVIALLHPESVILGGGVSLMGPLFWERLRAQVQRWSMPLFAPSVEVVPAALGESVVVLGALCLTK